MTSNEYDLQLSPRHTAIVAVDVQRNMYYGPQKAQDLYAELEDGGEKKEPYYHERVRHFVDAARPHGFHVVWVVLASPSYSSDHPAEPCLVTYDPVQSQTIVKFYNLPCNRHLPKHYGCLFDINEACSKGQVVWQQEIAKQKLSDVAKRFECDKMGIREGDDILVKFFGGAFEADLLNVRFRKCGIDTLIMFGMNTTQCLAASVFQALDDYRCIVPPDLLAECSAFSREMRSASMQETLLKKRLGARAQDIHLVYSDRLFAEISRHPRIDARRPPPLLYGWGAEYSSLKM